MRNWLIFSVLFIPLMLFGCTSQNSSYNTTATTTTTVPNNGPTAAVSIVNMAFSPASLTITAETTVIWTNNDSVAHTATSTAGPVSFDSGTITPGSTYSLKFSTTGNYTYICTFHPSMIGGITVQ